MRRGWLLLVYSWVGFVMKNGGSGYRWVGKTVEMIFWKVWPNRDISSLGFWLDVWNLWVNITLTLLYIRTISRIRQEIKP